MTCVKNNTPKPAIGENLSNRQKGIIGQQRNMDDIDESALRLKGSILLLEEEPPSPYASNGRLEDT